MNNEYKSYLLRQLGIKESQIKPSTVDRNVFPGIDPDEKKIIEEDLRLGGSLSPTAIATPVVAVAVRGSGTGGFPSGLDQTGIQSDTPTGRLGGYEPIEPGTANSKLVNGTPDNAQINSVNPITDNPQTIINPHPHQIQKNAGEPPQDVTGASTDGDNTLTLKSAIPKNVNVDVAEDESKKPSPAEKLNNMDGEETEEDKERDENLAKQGLHEGKHKAGCKCGFCMNKGKFGKKEKEEECHEAEEKEDKLDETFERHKKLAFENMKEKNIEESGTIASEAHPPGSSEPTQWKMDPEKAGMVKVDEGEKWMKDVGKGKKKGALKRELGMPEEKKIPTNKLKSIKATLHTKSEKEGKLSDKELKLSRMVTAALNMRGEG
jgi:hypothetical protein